MSHLTTEVAPTKGAPNPDLSLPTKPKKRKGRWSVLFVLAAVLILGTAALLHYRSKAPKTTGFAGAGGRRGGSGTGGPLAVVVNVAKTADINIILNGLGTVTPLATVTVRTQIPGYLTQINFAEDQLVNKGDVLAVIDSRPYQATLEQAQGQLSSALSRLLVVVERYPDLKATENFRDLQAQLEGTENRISVERRDFNTAVQNYDTAIKSFPAVFYAGAFGFGAKPYFAATAGAETPPKVQFDFNPPAAATNH